MGIGPKIFLGVVGTLVAVVLVVPVIAGLANQEGGAGPEAKPEPKPEAYWNNENLVGTTWEVPTERGTVTVTFRDGGRVEARHPLAEQFLNQPYLEGRWSVRGDQLHIGARIPPPIDRELEAAVNIEGRMIYGMLDGERIEARQVR